MFSEELEKIDWEETTKTIYSKTESDVLRALGKEHCDVDDFMALISPAAAKYLEPMAQLSKKYTEERFGKTISMFIPLYITNSCTNSCVYCGFHISNPMARTILTPEQIEDEYKAIKNWGLLRTCYCDRRKSGKSRSPLSGQSLGHRQKIFQQFENRGNAPQSRRICRN
jgi:thiH: thiazole biosynthesis protein ThiH